MIDSIVGGLASMVAVWLAVIVVLWLRRPDNATIRDTLRLLPDLLRMVRGLATDPTLPRSIRWRLWALLGYLALPIDLIPDFIPVLGYADDAIVVALTLRSVTRLAGPDALERHWPGSADGLAAVRQLARLSRHNYEA